MITIKCENTLEQALRLGKHWTSLDYEKTCRGCFYFSVCGDPTRTEPCKGKRRKENEII